MGRASEIVFPLPLRELKRLAVGERVYWNDPDHARASGFAAVVKIHTPSGRVQRREDIVFLKGEAGSDIEVLAQELSRHCPKSIMVKHTGDAGHSQEHCVYVPLWLVSAHGGDVRSVFESMTDVDAARITVIDKTVVYPRNSVRGPNLHSETRV